MHSGYMDMETEIDHLTMLPSIKQEGGVITPARRAELLNSRRRRQEVVRGLDHLSILFSKLLDPILRL
jgi:hypothetical protein